MPPQRPTEADIPLLQFAESFELAARDLYQAAVDAGVDDAAFGGDAAPTTRRTPPILKGILGAQGERVAGPTTSTTSFEADFSTSDLAALAAAAYELESIAVATHTELLRELDGHRRRPA